MSGKETPESFEWKRPHFRPGGGYALLHYVVFGVVKLSQRLDLPQYRCTEIPDGLEFVSAESAEWFEEPLWSLAVRDTQAFGESIKRSARCGVIAGEVRDPPTLDYLRNSIGLVTFCLDHGGMAVLDSQTFRLWCPEEWRRVIFAPNAPVPSKHVDILYSQDEQNPGKEWFHTRGMRKFGRPDISVRGVGPNFNEGVIDLCNCFIEFQAFGGIIEEGREIKMQSLPPGGFCRHSGHLDDPAFNNVHVEVDY